MFPVPEQFSAATKSQLEAQLKIINTFASGAFNSAEKIIAFNFGITKAALEKSSAAAQQMLATKDARELFKFDATRTQTDLASVLLYGQQMLGITASPLHTASAALTIENTAVQAKSAEPVAAAPAVSPTIVAAPVAAAAQVGATPKAVKPAAPVAKPVAVKPTATPAAVVQPVAAAVPVAPAKAAAPKPAAPKPVAAKPVAVAPVAASKPAAPKPAAPKPAATMAAAKPAAATKPVIDATPEAKPKSNALAKPAVDIKPVTASKKGVSPFPKSPTKK